MKYQFVIDVDSDERTVTVSGGPANSVVVYHDATITVEYDVRTMPDCDDVTRLTQTGRRSFTIEGEIK